MNEQTQVTLDAVMERLDRMEKGAERTVGREVAKAESWLKAKHLWGLGAFAVLGAVGAFLWSFGSTLSSLGFGGHVEHAVTAGWRLGMETLWASFYALVALCVLAFALYEIPWVQRRVAPSRNEMTDVEEVYWILREKVVDGTATPQQAAVYSGVARTLGERSKGTWIGACIVFVGFLFVMSPLA